MVAVEFFVQGEIDRSPARAFALVIDEQGHLVMLDSSVPSWVPPERLKNFKIKTLGQGGEGWDAEYLGQDPVSGWNYLQVEEAARADLTPVTAFNSASPKLGEFIWGIAAMGEDWDYAPYFLSGRMSAQKPLPWEIGFSDRPIGSPGAAAFDAAGNFVGWIGTPTTDEKIIFMQGRKFPAAIQMVRESNAFLTAEEFQRYVGKIPATPTGGVKSWAGFAGLQPLDEDVASLMGLQDQGALVISDVIENSPAAQAGLQSRDIIVAMDGERLPKFVPTFILLRWIEKELLKLQPGESVILDVVSGNDGKEVELTLAAQPTTLKEARREYFDRLGLSARELTLADAMARRQFTAEVQGAVADFVKPNSPVQSAELQAGDWILEIDGQPIANYEEAVAAFHAVEQDESREEFVLLIERGTETKVLRAKLR